MAKSIGPIILDLVSSELSSEEREILQHPLVGGVILFTKNYQNSVQLASLCKQIRSIRQTPILITVDHEGGRVQRFQDGFTKIPAMGQLGQLFTTNTKKAEQVAFDSGWVMAIELLSMGIDLSFAPVVDLNKNLNTVISDRAFHQDPNIVTKLAKLIIQGMHAAGMAATLKHFPGHGSVTLDSHTAIPIDKRSLAAITSGDMQPFSALVKTGVQAVMPAHIIFPEVDELPVGFSTVWLQDILRKKLQFNGVIFSDDLNMEGAGFVGDYLDRAKAALTAGCDMILICNNPKGAIQIIDGLSPAYKVDEVKFKSLQGKFNKDFVEVKKQQVWKECIERVNDFH